MEQLSPDRRLNGPQAGLPWRPAILLACVALLAAGEPAAAFAAPHVVGSHAWGVAHATVPVITGAAATPAADAGLEPSDALGLLLVVVGMSFWIFVGHFVAVGFRAIGRALSTPPAPPATATAPAPAPAANTGSHAAAQVAAPAAHSAPGPPATQDAVPTSSINRESDSGRRVHQEDVAFAIQRAVGATADAYRDRLRDILERQDGPGWFDAYNERRCRDIVAKGGPAPRPYQSFDTRAVVSCLGYDDAALHLIPGEAAAAAKALSGLANAAHHLTPTSPLSENDARRAWRLYSQITGNPVPAGALASFR
jgi:pyruvate/2-oxoglutarate dehydrogenase complex dihydrolipoamide acyltransferase (E2) component